jgi:molybdopterin-guanine dinucleotide biosynthesis protein A
MPPTAFSAVVLAAGLSTRMKSDKALLEVDGVPLWQRQRDVLRRAGAAEIFFSVRQEQRWAIGEDVVHDAVPGCGPLAGIVAASNRMTLAHLAVLAVDLPRIEASWYTGMLAECGTDTGVVGRQSGAGGFFEPLAAIFPPGFFSLAREALGRGDFSMQRLVSAAVARGMLRVHVLTPPESAMFMNWNAPAE